MKKILHLRLQLHNCTRNNNNIGVWVEWHQSSNANHPNILTELTLTEFLMINIGIYCTKVTVI